MLCTLHSRFLGCKLADPAPELIPVAGQHTLALDLDLLVLEFLISISIGEHKDKEGSNFIVSHGYFSGQEPKIRLSGIAVRTKPLAPVSTFGEMIPLFC